jgi:hypothetical protein
VKKELEEGMKEKDQDQYHHDYATVIISPKSILAFVSLQHNQRLSYSITERPNHLCGGRSFYLDAIRSKQPAQCFS